jgi:tetratricopeptide (TPR) repeat protein
MTLNEVVAPAAKADAAMVARAHAYRAQANLGLEEPERARAAARLALEVDPSIVVAAPPFSPAVVALFEGLRGPSTADPETAGLLAEKSGRYQDAFLAYLSAFQRLPEPVPADDDRRLRERIIEVVRRLTATPTIPQEARARFTKAEELLAAEALLGGAGTAASTAAAAELRAAIRVAPWWPEATFKLAGVLQKLQRVDDALINLNLYRLAAPEAYAAAMNPNGSAAAAMTPARVAPPAVEPAVPKRASIYVYWPRGLRGNGERKVLCDGFHVADLENRRYILLDVMPGSHTIKLNDKTLAVSVEAGREYYLRTYVGGYPARLMFKEAPADQGLTDLNDKTMSANVPRLTYSGECDAGRDAGRRRF